MRRTYRFPANVPVANHLKTNLRLLFRLQDMDSDSMAKVRRWASECNRRSQQQFGRKLCGVLAGGYNELES